MFRRKTVYVSVALVVLSMVALVGYSQFVEYRRESAGFQQVANGDAQFWLMQGPPNNRYIPVTVDYYFDAPLDEGVVLERLKSLASSYDMFRRNVVEIGGMPYWQTVEPDWDVHFQVLDPGEDIDPLRASADAEISQPAEPGEGLPLFRVFLSSDRRQLTFVWHHVYSDLEGMFNKHAKHLFEETGERTRFGYQLRAAGQNTDQDKGSEPPAPSDESYPPLGGEDRTLGFTGTDFKVKRIVLPVKDTELFEMGQAVGLPMSDIFSFISVRAVTRYHQDEPHDIRPIISPLSLRTSSLQLDEGNNRSTKQFPVVFPMESVERTYQRIVSLRPTSTSYDDAGRVMKIGRRFSFLEPYLRKVLMPDYISNYFPLADGMFAIDDAVLVRHHLRVPMVPYERVKFAWSNYNGEVQLFLHTDPVLVEAERMTASYDAAVAEVLAFLSEKGAE